MNKLRLTLLLVTLLPVSALADSPSSSPTPRRTLTSPSDGARLDAEGKHSSRRRPRRREVEGGNTSTGGKQGTGSNSNQPSGQTSGHTSGQSSGHTSGQTSDNTWTRRFQAPPTPPNEPFVSHSSDRPRYATPEPGGYGELLLAAVGLAIYTRRRR
jgi:hypothetical protein